MFPDFAQFRLDRYYNVLPFVPVVLGVGYVADKHGRLGLLYGGLAAVGASLVLFQLEEDALRYVSSQTAAQIGWACLNLYVWVWAADLVFDYKNIRLQNVVVAVFLLGTAFGAGMTLAFQEALIQRRQGFLLTLPLFAAIALMSRIATARALPSSDERLNRTKALPPHIPKTRCRQPPRAQRACSSQICR